MKDYQMKLFKDANEQLSVLQDRVWGAFSPRYTNRDLIRYHLNQARVELTKLMLEIESEADKNEFRTEES